MSFFLNDTAVQETSINHLLRPGEFRGLRGLRGPEKKSAKSEVRGMNLIKVREIRGPRNEFLQKSAKSEISRNINLKCLRCVALPQASLAIYVFTYGEGQERNEFLQKSAKSEISRNINLKCLRCVALPQASLAIYVFTYGEGHQRNEFLQKSAKSEISRNINLKCLRCVALPQASLAILFMFYLWRGAPAVDLAQCNIFGLQLWFFAVSLPTSDSHISPIWPGTTPITSNTLQGSCRKQKAIYYAKSMRNYEITMARKIFSKLKDTSEHSLTM